MEDGFRRGLALVIALVALPITLDGLASVLQSIANDENLAGSIREHGLPFGLLPLAKFVAAAAGAATLVAAGRTARGANDAAPWLFAGLLGLAASAALTALYQAGSAYELVGQYGLHLYSVSLAVRFLAPDLTLVLLFAGLAVLCRPRRPTGVSDEPRHDVP